MDMQNLHRARDRVVGERTALINQLRAILLERGIIVPQGRRRLENWLHLAMSEGTLALSPRMMVLIEDMRTQWSEMDRRITAFDEEFKAYARSDQACRLLTSIPGIGPLNATALTAMIGNAGALAAKLARIAGAILQSGRPFSSESLEPLKQA